MPLFCRLGGQKLCQRTSKTLASFLSVLSLFSLLVYFFSHSGLSKLQYAFWESLLHRVMLHHCSLGNKGTPHIIQRPSSVLDHSFSNEKNYFFILISLTPTYKKVYFLYPNSIKKELIRQYTGGASYLICPLFTNYIQVYKSTPFPPSSTCQGYTFFSRLLIGQNPHT